MYIRCDEDEICVIIPSACLLWRDVVNNHIPQCQRLLTDRALTMLCHKHRYPVVVQFYTCSLYRIFHKLPQQSGIHCILQRVDFCPARLCVAAYILWKTHRRLGFNSVNREQRKFSHVENFPMKVPIELLKCLAPQARAVSVSFGSA